MNAISHSRASHAIKQVKGVAPLKAQMLFSPAQLVMTRLFSGLAHRAQAVVDFLEPFAKRQPLDGELNAILRKAQDTLHRARRTRLAH